MIWLTNKTKIKTQASIPIINSSLVVGCHISPLKPILSANNNNNLIVMKYTTVGSGNVSTKVDAINFLHFI